MRWKGVLMIESVLTLMVVMILFGTGVFMGTKTLQNIRSDDLKNQCDILDRSLETWSTSHQGVDEKSIRFNLEGKMYYAKQRLYPSSLDELGELQNVGFFSRKIDISQFSYHTQDNGTRYILEVTLPNGQLYKSPQSSL